MATEALLSETGLRAVQRPQIVALLPSTRSHPEHLWVLARLECNPQNRPLLDEAARTAELFDAGTSILRLWRAAILARAKDHLRAQWCRILR